MNKRTGLVLLLIVVLAGVGLWSWQGSKCAGKLAVKTVMPVSDEELDLSGTLVARIPQDSYGFVQWDHSHPSVKKLNNSPWGKAQTSLGSLAKSGANMPGAEVLGAMRAAGLDLTSPVVMQSLLYKGALFVAPEKEKALGIIAGLVFESDGSASVDEKFSAVKAELEKSGVEVEDLSISGGSGFRFTPKDSISKGAKAVTVSVAWKGNLGAVATSDAAVQAVLDSEAKTLPKVVDSPLFERATKGLLSSDVRASSVFFDLTELLSDAAAAEAISPIQKMKLANVPVQAVSGASGMAEAPVNEVRVLFKPEDKRMKGLFSESSSQKLLKMVPDKSFLFLSVDGKTVAAIKNLVMGQVPKGAEANPLSFLDDISRIGIAARVGAAGQTMFPLPLPEVVLIAETKNAAELAKTVEEIISQQAKSSQMGGTEWTEAKMGETTVRSLMSPLGLGVSLASVDNLVVATSSQEYLKTALSSGSSFAGSLPSKTGSLLKGEDCVANLYLNFPELAKLAEGLGGMLAMYAPQDEGVKKLSDPETIETLKQMGVMVGWMTAGEDMLRLRSVGEASVTQ